jgi:hypothetical protein
VVQNLDEDRILELVSVQQKSCSELWLYTISIIHYILKRTERIFRIYCS